MIAGEDPYFAHYYRINFDGTGLDARSRRPTATTPSTSRPISKYYVDT